MGLRAIMVAVDYTDLLAVTLPYNRHHFEDVWIITDEKSYGDVSAVAWPDMIPQNGPKILVTDLFYADNAVFNKWRALEWGLDQMGRHGWITLMDADVLWPRWVSENGSEGSLWRYLRPGYLYSPLRRMCVDLSGPDCHDWSGQFVTPPESHWKYYPLHRNVNEWAGYTQIFHSDDPVLGSPPWHEIDWKHAGGADSMFQAKWPRQRRVRPPFEVLHLGPAGVNWCGRVTPRLDGSVPEQAGERGEMMRGIWEGRRRAGKGKFDQEKLR